MKSQIIKPLLLLFLLVLCSHIVSGQKPVSSLEYSIYGAVLRALDRDYRKEHNGETEHYIILTELFDYRKQELVASGRKLVYGMRAKPKYTLVDESDVKGLVEKGRLEFEEAIKKARLESRPYPGGMCGGSVWKHFYATYPDSNGYYQFSKITFDRRRHRAQVEVRGIGAGWNSHMHYELIQTRRGWRIQTSYGDFSVC